MGKKLFLSFLFLIFSLYSEAANILIARKVAQLPIIDGVVDSLWEKAQAVDLDTKPIDPRFDKLNPDWHQGRYAETAKVTLKALYNGEFISFLVVWTDASKDDEHLYLLWDASKNQYIDDETSTLEDSFAFAFGMTDNFCGCMIVPEDTIHDVWHWKANRTNELGFLHDQRHIISTKPLLKAIKINTLNGKEIWLKRPWDNGKPPYTMADPYENKGDKIPKYTIQIPTESTADVTGKGTWDKGRWTLETLRKLDTAHTDDIIFHPGKTVKMAVAVFNSTAAHYHNVTEIIELKLE